MKRAHQTCTRNVDLLNIEQISQVWYESRSLFQHVLYSMTTAAMRAHPLDVGILIVFLIANLIVGFCYGRSTKTLRDYALGGRNFSTATLVATIVATWIGGDIFYTILHHTYTDGLYFTIVILGASICLLVVSYLVTRMGRFLNKISVAEAMGDMYGKTVRIVTAISGILSVIGIVAIEFQVIGEVITLIFGHVSNWMTVVAATVVIAYSVSGGIRAVTFTDVLQFFVFGTFIPLIALVIWNNLKDPNQVVAMLSANPIFNPREVIGWNPRFLETLALFGCFVIPALDPVVFQRISMSRNVLQAKQAFQYAGIISMIINLFMVWVGILLLSSDRTLEPTRLFTHIIDNYASTGLRGCICVGVIALAMSTADSYPNAAAVLLTNDIVKPLRIVGNREVFITKTFCLICGIFALLLALRSSGLLEVLLLSNSFYMPIVSVPLLLSILGFHTRQRVILSGMIAGFLTVVLWSFFLTNGQSIVPGMLANLVTVLSAHYLLGEKGVNMIVDIHRFLHIVYVSRRQVWQRRRQALNSFKFKLYPYLRQNLPTQESFYFFFGLYAIVATYFTFYTIDETQGQTYSMYEEMLYAVLFSATAFMTFPVWPPAVKSDRFMTFFWPLGIGGILFFAGTFLLILSQFHHLQIMVMMINLLMAVLLLQWPLALFLAFIGVYAAILCFTHTTGMHLPISTLGSVQMLYFTLLFASLLIVLKSSQAYRGLASSHALLKTENNFASHVILSMLRHKASILQDVSSFFSHVVGQHPSKLRDPVEVFHHRPSKEQLHVENAALHQHIYQLDTLNQHLRQVLHRTQHPLLLSVESMALKKLWQEVMQRMSQHKETIKKVITQYYTACEVLEADTQKIQRLLLNGLSYATSRQHANRPILLGFEATQLAYPIVSIPGYIKYIKAVRMTMTTDQTLPILKQWYLGSVDQAEGQWAQALSALPIAYNQQIAEAHYGVAELIHHSGGVTLMYVIPERVREIRPAIMDQYQLLAITSSQEAHVHPREVAFVKTVLNQAPMMEKRELDQALWFIKAYHGKDEHATGELRYIYAIGVAHTVLTYTQDTNTLLAALLHAVIDKTHCSLHHIAFQFNPVVQRIVHGVSRVDSSLESGKKLQLSRRELLHKLSKEDDERVLYVKLADRLHNMRTIGGHQSLVKQKKIAEETLQFFVPMARNLGLKPIAKELQERCFEVLNRK